jgi:hypothetical protein
LEEAPEIEPEYLSYLNDVINAFFDEIEGEEIEFLPFDKCRVKV